MLVGSPAGTAACYARFLSWAMQRAPDVQPPKGPGLLSQDSVVQNGHGFTPAATIGPFGVTIYQN
jgi:hypothetical protein